LVFNQKHLTRLLTTLTEEETCRTLRRALRKEGLKVSEEVDLSREIERHIGLSLRKYINLSVWSPLATYQAMLAIPEAGLFVPFHLAVTSHQGKTLVMVVNPEWLAQVIDRIGFRLLAKDVSAKLKRARASLEASEVTQEELETPTAIS
jgi:uncharacterized protein (DUF302 family)